VVPHLIDGGLSILQYADDTILFMDHDLEEIRNLKLILTSFEQFSGLKINFHKNELFFPVRLSTFNILLVKWSVVCRPKDQGGLGVHDFELRSGHCWKNGWPSY
jgi:hypothetical protein